MGQYYYIVNMSKRQFLDPHKFGDGMKLLEFGCSQTGTLTALAVLLADGNGRGGGDLHSENPIIGSWKGDRIVIAGDYADPLGPTAGITDADRQAVAKKAFSEGYQDPTKVNIYCLCCHSKKFTDISEQAMAAMLDDQYIADEIKKNATPGPNEPPGYVPPIRKAYQKARAIQKKLQAEQPKTEAPAA